MLLLRNVNCFYIVQLIFFFFSNFFFFFIFKEVTYLMTTKNAKKVLKFTKKVLFCCLF